MYVYVLYIFLIIFMSIIPTLFFFCRIFYLNKIPPYKTFVKQYKYIKTGGHMIAAFFGLLLSPLH